jgi:dGTPase
MKRFLRTHLYQHYQVLRMASKAQRIVGDLFAAFTANPRLLAAAVPAARRGDQARGWPTILPG